MQNIDHQQTSAALFELAGALDTIATRLAHTTGPGTRHYFGTSAKKARLHARWHLHPLGTLPLHHRAEDTALQLADLCDILSGECTTPEGIAFWKAKRELLLRVRDYHRDVIAELTANLRRKENSPPPLTETRAALHS